MPLPLLRKPAESDHRKANGCRSGLHGHQQKRVGISAQAGLSCSTRGEERETPQHAGGRTGKGHRVRERESRNRETQRGRENRRAACTPSHPPSMDFLVVHKVLPPLLAY
eukprot:scaffold28105_cov139-Isochrysis_galbana.AAC.5